MPHHHWITTGILTALITPSVLLAQAPAMQRADTLPTFIGSTGRATVRMAPDRATLHLIVQSNSATPAEAAEAVTRSEKAVLDTLLKMGLARDAIASTPYGVGIARDPQGRGPGSFFTGRTVVTLRITQLDRMAALTSAALARGAGLIGQPRFESTSEEAMRTRATREAVADAERHARALAEGMRGRLGRLREMSADEPFRYNEAQQQAYLPADTPYESQQRPAPEVIISIQVRGRWELILPP